MNQVLETPNLAPSPSYLDYWEDIAPNDPAARRIGSVVKTLANVALGHEGASIVNTDQVVEHAPPLQAEAWYRLLGPLNGLEGSEQDLTRAASMMQARQVFGEKASAELDLDAAYLLTDLSRVRPSMEMRKDALYGAFQKVKEIETSPTFGKRDAIYRLQTAILKSDIQQQASRLRYTGDTQPKPLAGSEYRDFERSFAKHEKQAIAQFRQLVNEKITDQNFGILLEWYFIIARRHQTWADEEIDTVSVRGATSRENGAGWLSTSGVKYPAPKTGNHDVVVSSYRPNQNPYEERIQLKAYDYLDPQDDTYDRSAVTVIDLKKIVKSAGTNLDKTTAVLIQNISKFEADYAQH